MSQLMQGSERGEGWTDCHSMSLKWTWWHPWKWLPSNLRNSWQRHEWVLAESWWWDSRRPPQACAFRSQWYVPQWWVLNAGLSPLLYCTVLVNNSLLLLLLTTVRLADDDATGWYNDKLWWKNGNRYRAIHFGGDWGIGGRVTTSQRGHFWLGSQGWKTQVKWTREIQVYNALTETLQKKS